MPYTLTAGGKSATVYQWPCRAYDIRTYSGKIYKHIADSMAFAIVTGEGPMAFEVKPEKAFTSVKVRPLSAGVQFTVKDGVIRFTLTKPATISVELDGDLLEPLFVFYSPKTPKPEKADYYFAPGEHDAGMIMLKSGETAYLEAGAIVHGCIHAENAENIAILGEGVLTGLKMHRENADQKRTQLIDIRHSKNIRIGAVTLYDGPGWHCRILDCEKVEIDGERIISMNPSGDGIDVCNSRHVHIQNCFFRTNDDCITLKALYKVHGDEIPPAMYDIVSEKCVCWSATHGNGLEVGYETCTAEMYDIHFKNCDIIHCEREGYQSGGTLTIHNGDRADIHDVYYDDIRIEDSREKIFDLKICNACWSHDPIRGQIRDIYFKNIAIVDGPFPPSIIKGFEAKSSEFAVKHDEEGKLWVLRDLHGEGTLKNIVIENFTVYGRKKTDFMEAKCLVEIATDVIFK